MKQKRLSNEILKKVGDCRTK